TRVSIKVRLAWSTCAQMGLLLVECALGLLELALLHLLAHSLYKAYAFLNSGRAVTQHLSSQLVAARHPALRDWLGALAVSLGLAGSAMWLSGSAEGPYSGWLLVALLLAVLMAERQGPLNTKQVLGSIGLAGLLVTAYTVQKGLAAHLVDLPPTELSLIADLWICCLLLSLSAGYLLLRHGQEHAAGRSLWMHLYAG